jgi:hypothetical protein
VNNYTLNDPLTEIFYLEYFPIYSVALECAKDRCATFYFPDRKLSGKFGVLYEEKIMIYTDVLQMQYL